MTQIRYQDRRSPSSDADAQELASRLEVAEAEIARLNRKDQFLERQLRAMTVLTKSRSITNGNLQTALMEITRATSQTLDVDRVGIWFFEPGFESIRCVEIHDRRGPVENLDLVIPASSCPAYFQEILTGRVVDADDARTDSRTLEFEPGYLVPMGIHSMLDVPIRARGEMAGIICHEHRSPRVWQLEEIHFASFAASLVVLAMEARDRVAAEAMLQKNLDGQRG